MAGVCTLSALPILIVVLFPGYFNFVIAPAPYVVFHNIAEFFSIMVSLSIFGIGWYTYDQTGDRHSLFLSTGFLAIGLMDFMHTLGNAAMPAFVTPNSSNKSTQFWISVRLFQAAVFLVSAFIYSGDQRRWLSKRILLSAALLVPGTVFAGITFFPSSVPDTFIQGVGLTPFKKYSEFLVVGLLCLSLAAYWQRMARSGSRLLLYYLAALIVSIFSEICFAVYTRVFDTYNVVGHIYKVAAFSLIYKGIFIVSVKDPYSKLAEGEHARRLASFPELNPNPVLEVAPSREITFFNPATEKTLVNLGMDKNDPGVFLPGDIEAILRDLEKKTESTLSREVTLKDRVFGQTIYLTPQFNVARVYVNDITGRKRMEEERERLLAEVRRQTAELGVQQIELQAQNEELRTAQVELEASRRNYADLYNFAPLGYFTLDTNGIILEVNLAGANLLGIDKQFLLNKPFSVFIAGPDDSEVLRRHRKTTYTSQNRQSCDLALKRKDGSIFYTHLESIAVENIDGKAGYIRTAVIDITERKRAEEARSRLSAIVESSEDAISSTNMDGILLTWNRGAEKVYGYHADEVIGKHVSILYPQERSSELPQLIEKISCGESIERFETVRVRKDGKTVQVSITLSPVKDSAGNMVAVSAITRDITIQKQAEEALLKEHREIALANRLLDVFVKETGNDLYDKALNIMLEAMESRHGVFGYIDEQGDLICPTMSKLFDQCEIAGKCICYTRDKWKGLWSRALLEKKTLFSNKTAIVPRGHMPIRNNMAVPILFQGNVIGLINLANKDTGYTEEDRDFIEAISNKIAPVLFAWIQKELRENERKRAKERISRQNAVLDGINKIFREALACDTEDELGRACLNVAEELTQSRFGFINEMGSDGLLHTIAISDPGWDLCAMHDKAGHCRPPGNFKVHGLYGRVMLDKKSFFTNDPASHPDSIGTPEGHPFLKAFLGVPLIHGGETIGMMGLGNREEGYRNEDLEAAEALSQAIVQVLMRKRMEERVAHLASFPEMDPAPIIELRPCGDVIYVNSVVRTQFPDLPVMGPSHPLLSNWPEISAGFSDGKTCFLFLEAEAGGKAFYQAVYYARQLDVIRIYNADITGRKRAEEKLIRLNDELERRVKERTEDLAKTVATLRLEMDDRQRAEEEIVRLAAAVESAADAIVITEQGAIRYVNPAFEKMTGYSRDEVNGRDLHLFDSGHHDETYFIKVREILKNDGVWTGRLINKKKDGTLYEEECTYAPIRGRSGEILNYMAIKRDVTEKVRLESIAQAVDTMNNIGYIFSGVRHEIGNPVTTIAMSLDLLLKKIEELDKQSIAKYVKGCIEQIEKVEYLLRCLKNFNMYEQLESRDIVLSEFMDKLVELVTNDFVKKGIAILVVVEPDDAKAYADPRALQQVLLNLFTNAADALVGRVDPKITVTVNKAKVVRIRVEDNGCGIPAHRLQDVFKPFYTTKAHGTGLGLMIARKMIAKMNGTLEITSTENTGTAVDISLSAGS